MTIKGKQLRGEKRMRKISMALAGAVLGLFGASSNAAILVNSQTVDGTGALAGDTIIRLYAAMLPGSDEVLGGAKGLQSAKVTIDSDQPMKITTAALNAPFVPNDADIYGQDSSADAESGVPVDPRSDSANVGTFVRVGTSAFAPWAPQYLEGAPGVGVNLIGRNATSGSANPPVTAAEIQTNFGSTKHLRVDGILQASFDATALTPNNNPGSGALFAVVVVPKGAKVTVTGQLAGDSGAISDFTYPVPEPTSLTLLGIGAVGLLGRRRRA
jgi:hypothetical protein